MSITAIVATALFILLTFGSFAVAGSAELDKLAAKIAARYPSIGHIAPADLVQLMKSEPDLVLIDTREADEYGVSHIAGAERLDPNAWVWTFNNRFANRIKGRTVVFYCSVGVRSSRMADHVRDAALSAGAKRVLNLSGGIFAWHNQRLPLRTSTGPTDFVHPYDETWGLLLERRGQWRMKAPAAPLAVTE